MAKFTEDGSSSIVKGGSANLMFTGDIGGGTLTVQRLIENGRKTDDADWRPVADAGGSAEYTESPSGGRYTVSRRTQLRVRLTGSTNPDLEYTFRSE